ncbi:MAG TPA: hypothetical protein VGB02_18500 [Pyrinomonadaceae bacterium]|jgi:hypothetical protein
MADKLLEYCGITEQVEVRIKNNLHKLSTADLQATHLAAKSLYDKHDSEKTTVGATKEMVYFRVIKVFALKELESRLTSLKE